MTATKYKNKLKVTLDLEECFRFNIFEIVLNPKSDLSKQILSAVFLSACKKADFKNFSGNYSVEIFFDKDGNSTMYFDKSVAKVSVKLDAMIFIFQQTDDMISCIKALYKLTNVKSQLYYFKNKYYLYIPFSKQNFLICKEFGTKQNYKKTKTVLFSNARLIDNDVIKNFGEKLDAFEF